MAANQADEVVAPKVAGQAVAKPVAYRAVRRAKPDGLLFPATLVVVDDDVFVPNLAAALTDAVGDEPEEDARCWTVSHTKLR